MALAEVNAVFNLLATATSFLTQAQAGWYKRSAELEAFKDQVRVLSDRRLQWSEQLRRHGISEDPLLLGAVENMKRSRLLRLRKKAFPSNLSYAMTQVLEVVNAGPQLLSERAATHDLLDRTLTQTPARLPFIHDSKYVPIEYSVKEVQAALENAEGPRVVTIYGMPGMGKSSLAKYVALHYQEQYAPSRDSGKVTRDHIHDSNGKAIAFRDGVQYLFCGLGGTERIKELLLELVGNLRFGAGSSPLSPYDSTCASAGFQADMLLSVEHSCKMKLKSRLAEQTLLIILDDLWEMEVLGALLVPANGVRYLITSQNKEIWRDAEQIHLKRPSETECRQIMANHTAGLPTKGQFPLEIQGVTDDIIKELEYHPLSLANVGASIMRNRETEASHWEERKKYLLPLLDDERAVPNGPLAYETPYNLTVSASMMVMVDSLPLEARRILDLMALFDQNQGVRQDLLIFFYACIQSTSGSNYECNILMKYLVDRSLTCMRKEGNDWMLEAHGLRTHFIREKRKPEVSDVVARILEGSDGHLAHPTDQQTLAFILSAMHFAEPFMKLVADTFKNQIIVVMNGEVIPRSINTDIDTLDLLKKIRDGDSSMRMRVEKFFPLLSPNGRDSWEQQACEAATKVIITFVCRGRWDDESMARLLQLPQTTSTACEAMRYILRAKSSRQGITFSIVYGETMKNLLALLHDNLAATSRRAAVIFVLPYVLKFETTDMIFGIVEVLKALIAMDSESTLQVACSEAFASSLIDVIPKSVYQNVWELLVSQLASRTLNDTVRVSMGRTIFAIAQRLRHDPKVIKIECLPQALSMLFDVFVSEDQRVDIKSFAGRTLLELSLVPDNVVRIGALCGVKEGLVNMLANMDGWIEQLRGRRSFYKSPLQERPAIVACQVLGEMLLVKQPGETLASFPGLVERLLDLQLREVAESSNFQRALGECGSLTSTATLAILHSVKPQPELTSFPDWSQVLVADELLQIISRPYDQPDLEFAYLKFYESQVQVYLKMQFYQEALLAVDLVEQHLNRVPVDPCSFGLAWTRYMRIYVQALSKDYDAAVLGVTSNIERIGQNGHDLVNRAVIKSLSGDLQGALDDFNAALNTEGAQTFKEGRWRVALCRRGKMYFHGTLSLIEPYDKFPFYYTHDVFKHRGYVKHLMGDIEGATKDAEKARESAQEYHLRRQHVFLQRLRDASSRKVYSQRQLINFLGLKSAFSD